MKVLLLRKLVFTLRIDLQGQGKTPGTAITFGLCESADVVAAPAWIKKEVPGRRHGLLRVAPWIPRLRDRPEPQAIGAPRVSYVRYLSTNRQSGVLAQEWPARAETGERVTPVVPISWILLRNAEN